VAVVVADVDVGNMGCIVGLAAMGIIKKWHHFFCLVAQM
jgi:hypothetical protein